MITLNSDTSKPAPGRRGQPDVASLPDEQSAVLVVPGRHEIIAVFRPDGRKVAFISRTLLDPVKVNALLEWGDRDLWAANPILAKKWGVRLVIGDPAWCATQLAQNVATPPEGIRFAFFDYTI
jgi:hypothetical protein